MLMKHKANSTAKSATTKKPSTSTSAVKTKASTTGATKKIKPVAKPKKIKPKKVPVKKGGRPRRKTKKVPRLPKVDGVVARPAPHDETKIALSVDNVTFFKNSDCTYYEQCMNHAAKKGWSQFHCRACKIYKEDETVDDQMRIALGRFNSGLNEPIY
jgi:hypothetical protein